MEDFNIYLTFDIDQDFDPGSKDYYNRTAAKFDSFGAGFQKIINVLGGKPFSVFIRSDYQVSKIYGSYDYLIASNPTLIESIKRSGGELNWHIHLYCEKEGEWVPVLDDDLVEAFTTDCEQVKNISAINWRIVRIGECVMTNDLMHTLDKMGIRADSTALPGRKRDDAEKKLDWSITGNEPYHPSSVDYRAAGNDSLGILEIPMVTIPMKASYDKQPISRYVNLSFKTDVLFQNMDEFICKSGGLLSITHPFEVLSPGTHGLIAYDMQTFERNIKELEAAVLRCGKKPVFKRVSDILQ